MTMPEIAHSLADVPSIPAATLVLFRKGSDRAEHLFVERAAAMAFAGGAVVFPGGRVDPGDYALAERHLDLDLDEAAARIAAVRETIEETGVAVGVRGDAFDVAVMRAALAQGEAFGDLLDEAGLTLDLGALTPFARWCPRFRRERSFDTRFYLAAAPADYTASVDATENVRLFWATAADILARADDGALKIIFPTRRNLERLAGFADLQAAQVDARRYPATTITPWVEEHDGVKQLRIPEGLGYPVTAEALTAATRG